MKTKSEIIQRLLDEKSINVEEAMILMMTEKEYVYIPNYPTYPTYPTAPIYPGFPEINYQNNSNQ